MPVRKRGVKWYVDVHVGHGECFRQAVGNKKEAEALERELVARAVSGTFPVKPVADVRFCDFAEEYLEHATVNKAPKTVYNEKWMLESNLVPFFGKWTLAQIDAVLVERYKAHRLKKGVGPRTVNIDLQLLSVMFRLAVKRGYVRRNPVLEVERMKETERLPRFLSQQEVKQFLEAAKDTYLYPLIVTALHTGMRKAELFNLCWSDVDFENDTVTVQSKDDWTTKNRKVRVLEMTPALRDVLRKEYERREEGQEFVFTYRGRRLTWGVKKMLATISRQAGVEVVNLHTLRHTFASHLAMQGVPLMHIQQLLGHQDYQTTLIHAHVSTESHKSQVRRLPYADLPSEECP